MMNIHFYLLWFAIGGQLASCLIKFSSLRRQGKSIDEKVTPRWYAYQDWDLWVSQFVVTLVLFFAWSFACDTWPNIEKYGWAIFIIEGGVGAQILNAVFSKAQTEVIDKIKNYKP